MNNNQNNSNIEKLIKQLIDGYKKEHLEELGSDNRKENNSFVFLEKNTLHMFISFMLILLEKQHDIGVRSDESESSVKELSSYLDSIIEDNQKNFEELIDILKKT